MFLKLKSSDIIKFCMPNYILCYHFEMSHLKKKVMWVRLKNVLVLQLRFNNAVYIFWPCLVLRLNKTKICGIKSLNPKNSKSFHKCLKIWLLFGVFFLLKRDRWKKWKIKTSKMDSRHGLDYIVENAEYTTKLGAGKFEYLIKFQ